MAIQRKLGFSTDRRNAVLRGLTTAFLINGSINTTEQRAKEVQKIAEKLIASAAREADNFTSRSVKVSAAVKDSKGYKAMISATSKNGRKYKKVEREEKTDMKTVDNPSRLAARRNAIKYLYRFKDDEGNALNAVNILFDDIGPRYKSRDGGYTRIYKLGPRKGDAAQMAKLELV